METLREAFFASLRPGPLASRYCLWHAPSQVPPRGLVVCVHPFAEEMNKSRRMAALQSRSLAQVGLAVLQVDLLGCGDSAGDFGDATWQDWVQDVEQACALALERNASAWPGQSQPPLWLWGLRAGCLLAVAAAKSWPRCKLLLWQPPASGKQLLQQFLRLKMAATLGSESRVLADNVKGDLAAGRPVVVAGYTLSAALASGLEQALLTPPKSVTRVLWFEVRGGDSTDLLPATVLARDRWIAAGWQPVVEVVPGPAFWSTVEVEEVPALVSRTTAAVLAMPHP